MGEDVKVSEELSDIDQSFRLDDALRLKKLLDGKSSTTENTEQQKKQGEWRKEVERSDIGASCELYSSDLGSWTPLDLNRKASLHLSRKAQCIGYSQVNHADIGEKSRWPESGTGF